jgi:hypothetical protein
VCDTHAKGLKRSAFVRTEEVVRAAREEATKPQEKGCEVFFSITAGPALHGNSVVMNLLFPHVMQQSVTVGRLNRKTLWSCVALRGAAGVQFGYLRSRTVLQ